MFIADADGGIDWIAPPPPSEVPSDYLELMEGVDTLVMWRATYETSLALEGGMEVFAGRQAVVFTSREDLRPRPGVAFVHEAPERFVRRLRAETGGTIWLFGGGQLASALSAAGLIDDYLIVVQPVLLGTGMPLWRDGGRRALELVRVREWEGGLVELRYRPAGA